MELWELVLFLMACILGGTAVYILLVRLISVFLSMPQTITADISISPITYARPEPPPVSEGQLTLADLGLLAEIENNLRLATEAGTSELIPFDTHVWNTEQYEVYDLPAFLRNDLKQAYDMIRLANQVVWLSTEFSRRSQDIDNTYRRICTNIADKLQSIKQNAE